MQLNGGNNSWGAGSTRAWILEGLGRRAWEERRAPSPQHPQALPSGCSTGRVMTGSLAMDDHGCSCHLGPYSTVQVASAPLEMP